MADVAAKDLTEASGHNQQNTDIALINAKLLGIQGEILANGSFENIDSLGEPDLWDVTDINGGSHSIDETTQGDGLRSLKCVITDTGGYVEAEHETYLPVYPGARIELPFFFKTSVATARVRAQILWYSEGRTIISTVEVFDSASGNPSSWTHKNGYDLQAVCPATAYWYRVRLIAGESGNSVAANVWFDSIRPRLYHGPIIIDRVDVIIAVTPLWSQSTKILDLTLSSTPVEDNEIALTAFMGMWLQSGFDSVPTQSTMTSTGNGKASMSLTTPTIASGPYDPRFLSWDIELDAAQQCTINVNLGSGATYNNDIEMWLFGYDV